MRSLLTPWRYDYLVGEKNRDGCIFCSGLHATDDEKNLVVFRGAHNFIILNRYPYTNGHLMVVPNEHIALPSQSTPQQRSELMELASVCESVLAEVYKADGINMGLNLGRAAGAGVEEHYHLHVVPRWDGDTSFMTVTADTRIIPEELSVTFSRLRKILADRTGHGQNDDA